MFDFRCSVAVAAAAIVLSLTSAESAFATTGTKFLDFTNGTTGWTTKGTTTKITATKSSNFGGKPFSLTPASGEAMIEISPSGSTTLIGTMDSVLGLSNGTVLAAVGSSASGGSPNGTTAATYGPGDTTNYGVMVKDFTLTAGTYSFAWAYSASDYLPYTDGVFWSIAGGGVNQFNMLARNGADFVVPGSFKGFPAGTSVLQSFGSIPWSTQTFEITADGVYKIGFGSFNALDQGVEPFLYVSGLAGTFTGTPVATSGGTGGGGGGATDIGAGQSATISQLGSTYNAAFAGGTLNLSSGDSSASNFTVAASGGTLSLSSGSATLSGVFSGAGGVIKTGAGVLTLSGANTYAGGTTVSGGTLKGTTTSLQGAITNNATTEFSQNTNGTYSGVMSGTGSLVKSGTGTVTLSGANNYTGGTTVSGGTLIGSTTSLKGAITNNATTEFSQSTNGTYSGVMSGTGELVKSGTGVVTLSGANTYTGATTITSGTLALSGDGSVANSTFVNTSGILDISGTTNGTSIKGLIGLSSGGVNLGSKTLTINNSDTTNGFLFEGVISGTGGLATSGTATQFLSAVQTYSGATSIGAGSTLALELDGSIAASSGLTNDGTLDIGDTSSGTSIKTLAGSGAVILGSKTLSITDGSTTFAGTISGSGGLTITGGTQALTGANTYAGGTTVSGGTLKGTTTSLQGAITNNATTEFSQNTNGTYSGVMSGTGSLVKSGTGVLTLSGTNTYTGGTTVSGGTLAGTSNSIWGNVTNNSTVQFDQSFNGTYTGNMTGTGAFVKSGSGVLTLATAMNLSGNAAIIAGGLKVFGFASFSNLLCGGASATSLYGTGTIKGGVVVGGGCTLAPGASLGTLTFDGNVTLSAGSFYNVEIDGRVYNAAGGAGTYDRAVLSTAGSIFTAGGTLVPKLRGLEGAANNNFTAMIGDRFTVVTGANAGAFASVSQPTAGLVANSRFDVLYLSSAIDLVVTPNSFAVLGQSDGWTKNAISAAAGYDAIRPAAGTRTGATVGLFSSLYQANRSSLGATFHQMSGQIFADAIQSARFTIENAQDSILGASINDLAGTESGEVAVWADVIGRKAEGDSDGTALGYDDEMKGVAVGIALGMGEGSHIGLGTSYGSSELQAALDSRADVDVKTLYGFGGGKLSDNLSYSLMAGVSKYDAATTRALTIANVTTRAKGVGSGGSKQLGAYLRFSQPAFASGRVSVTGGVQSYWFNTRTITENIVAADGGLTVASEDWKQTQGVINAEWVIGSGRVRGVLFGELQYDFDEDAASDQRKVMDSYGGSWLVSAPAVERTQNTLGVGLHADLGDSSGLRFEMTNSNRGDGFSDRGGFIRLFFNR